MNKLWNCLIILCLLVGYSRAYSPSIHSILSITSGSCVDLDEWAAYMVNEDQFDRWKPSVKVISYNSTVRQGSQQYVLSGMPIDLTPTANYSISYTRINIKTDGYSHDYDIFSGNIWFQNCTLIIPLYTEVPGLFAGSLEIIITDRNNTQRMAAITLPVFVYTVCPEGYSVINGECKKYRLSRPAAIATGIVVVFVVMAIVSIFWYAIAYYLYRKVNVSSFYGIDKGNNKSEDGTENGVEMDSTNEYRDDIEEIDV